MAADASVLVVFDSTTLSFSTTKTMETHCRDPECSFCFCSPRE